MIGRLLRKPSHAAAFLLSLSVSLASGPYGAMGAGLQTDEHSAGATVLAADRVRERSPYGISEGGEYGEQREVTSTEEARKVLSEYFSKKNVKIGKITEKGLYYEAEIRDGKGNLVDVVIVDKRTGRIRSIY